MRGRRIVRLLFLVQLMVVIVLLIEYSLTDNTVTFTKASVDQCDRDTLKTSRHFSSQDLVIPSLREHVCAVKFQCDAEYSKARDSTLTRKPICRCFPRNLIGRVPLNITELQKTTWNMLLRRHRDLSPGGHWVPRDCISRRRVAVIVPYRDRQRHLRAFLAHIHPILQRQLLDYRIFVVEQNLPYEFNKASLMNIGYLEALKVFQMDCVLFHDVDTLIERDDNIVFCTNDYPLHFAAYADRFNYASMPFDDAPLFGSAILLTSDQMDTANGFSNLYYGWGAEDDDMRARLQFTGYTILKSAIELGRSTLMKHPRDTLFTNSSVDDSRYIYTTSKGMPSWYDVDGLNSVRYSILQIIHLPLFTWIHVDLKAPCLVESIYKDDSHQMKLLSDTRDKMLKGVRRAFEATSKVSPYEVTIGRCSNGIRLNEKMFVSRTTCRYLCDVNPECVGVEYHPGGLMANNTRDITDDYCVLLNNLIHCQKLHAVSEIHIKTIPPHVIDK